MNPIDWPFRGPEAVHNGTLTFRELRRFNRAIYPAVWILRDTVLSPQQLARAAWLWSDRRGVVSGLCASALLGAKWIDAGERAEIIHSNRRPPAGLVVHSDTLAPGETTEVSGMPVDGGSESPYESLTRLMLVRAEFRGR
ncbi:hypothetical protein [Mycolicibacterium frederiksbergense]|uniref:Uncharacterized protein n=1 Tax=Mycolicibacterium frederiksbergense TaxID=117567 RepID=A0A6H0S342_9MYCO|nr:hypothetical protein [Mycolicibacterium frederiksbergense]QIV80457.1 hypothetical protein EXE63_05795 [Mycolicibacterium frederiksbergense]